MSVLVSLSLYGAGHALAGSKCSSARCPFPRRVRPHHLQTFCLHFDMLLKDPGGGSGNPLQDSGLRNPMDRGAWWARVHGVTHSRT